jgi:hypothetical protein
VHRSKSGRIAEIGRCRRATRLGHSPLVLTVSFPSTAQRFGGTGLGLAITRKPARMGSLRATVRPQGGQHGQHDASDHHYPRGDPSRWRLVRPGTLVLGRSSGS